jgi:hypothetical protein
VHRVTTSSQHVRSLLPSLPLLEISRTEFDHSRPLYNESKVALLIENRARLLVAPVLLQMMATLPPDWRFRFMGSNESVELVKRSAAIRQQVQAGKLDLTYIPSNLSVKGQEAISNFLTNRWLYETVLAPAEYLLVFQTDSMYDLISCMKKYSVI